MACVEAEVECAVEGALTPYGQLLSFHVERYSFVFCS
jgi:hypothetical protein